tara:strand:+ start:160 stop:306 length:147 start_codon:yes stop_codon:yes gene_type:complete
VYNDKIKIIGIDIIPISYVDILDTNLIVVSENMITIKPSKNVTNLNLL